MGPCCVGGVQRGYTGSLRVEFFLAAVFFGWCSFFFWGVAGVG